MENFFINKKAKVTGIMVVLTICMLLISNMLPMNELLNMDAYAEASTVDVEETDLEETTAKLEKAEKEIEIYAKILKAISKKLMEEELTEEELVAYSNELNKCKTDIESTVIKFKQYKGEVKLLEDKINSSNLSNSTLITGLQSQISILSAEKDRLTVLNSNLQNENKSLNSQVSTLQDENKNLNLQMSTLQNENKSLNSQVSTLQDENKNLNSQMSTLQNENKSLNSQVSALQSEKISLGEEIKSLKNSSDTTASDNEALMKEVENALTENNELRKNIETANAELEYAKNSVQEKEVQITSLQEEVAELRKQNSMLNSEVKNNYNSSYKESYVNGSLTSSSVIGEETDKEKIDYKDGITEIVYDSTVKNVESDCVELGGTNVSLGEISSGGQEVADVSGATDGVWKIVATAIGITVVTLSGFLWMNKREVS